MRYLFAIVDVPWFEILGGPCMKLTHFRGAVAIAEHGSLRAAARRSDSHNRASLAAWPSWSAKSGRLCSSGGSKG